MFWLFKKKSKSETKEAPFEILFPENLTKGKMPDLRIGSKILDILRTSPMAVQTIEIFEGMPFVNSNNPQLKEFIETIITEKQISTLKKQITLMCFSPKKPDSQGVLCCIINGVLHEFHVHNSGGDALLNYQFTRVVSDNGIRTSLLPF